MINSFTTLCCMESLYHKYIKNTQKYLNDNKVFLQVGRILCLSRFIY